MRKILFIAAASLLLLVPLGSPGNGAPKKHDEADQLRQEIMAFHLVNGLYLTPDQARELLPLAREATTIVDQAQKSQEDLEVLRAMQKELAQSGQLSEGTKQRHHRQHEEAIQSRAQALEKLKLLTEQAKTVLNENQLELVARYKPCLVPPEDSREPRTGQAGGAHLEEMLARSRELTDEQYQAKRAQHRGRLRSKLVLELGPDKADAKLAEIEAVFDKARKMPAEEFALRKAEMAEGIKPEHPIRTGLELNKAIGRFLIGPGALPVLERLAAQS